jgi:hypothetical protein
VSSREDLLTLAKRVERGLRRAALSDEPILLTPAESDAYVSLADTLTAFLDQVEQADDAGDVHDPDRDGGLEAEAKVVAGSPISPTSPASSEPTSCPSAAP